MEITLDKIELIRERSGLSYSQARELLDEADGDVIEALVALEEEQGDDESDHGILKSDLLSPVKKVIRQSSHTKIRVKNKDGTLLEIPASLGIVGALLAPRATALGTMALLIAQYNLEVDHPVEIELETKY